MVGNFKFLGKGFNPNPSTITTPLQVSIRFDVCNCPVILSSFRKNFLSPSLRNFSICFSSKIIKNLFNSSENVQNVSSVFPSLLQYIRLLQNLHLLLKRETCILYCNIIQFYITFSTRKVQ